MTNLRRWANKKKRADRVRIMYWLKACHYENVCPAGFMVVFSDDNPWTKKYDIWVRISWKYHDLLKGTFYDNKTQSRGIRNQRSTR